VTASAGKSKALNPLHAELARHSDRPSKRRWVYGLSVGVHAALALAVGAMEVRKSRAATSIELANVPQKKAQPTPEPTPVAPTPPSPGPQRAAAAARKAAAPSPAPEPAAPAAANLDALPDFGLALSGSGSGTGVAVRAPAAQPAAPRATEPVVRRALNPAPATPSDGCEEPATKPRARSVPNPTYTDAARSAGIEGKVRVEVTIDATGKVTAVRVISGLGYGLDEAAVAAARAAQFEPAMRCGKPTSATFTIGMRFTAS